MSIRITSRSVWIYSLAAIVALTLLTGCPGSQPVSGYDVKVAKVDTEYVYEANVAHYVSEYRDSRHTTISTFLGFSPGEILGVRSAGINVQIRKEIKRLPGVSMLNSEVYALAAELVEELAGDIYSELTEGNGSFELMAMEHSIGFTASDGGALLPFGVRDEPEDYQSRTYEMEIGEISEPFYGRDGWRIIRLNDITDDPIAGQQYHISMIQLVQDYSVAEAELLDEIAQDHTVEYLDPKYNSLQALIEENYASALSFADDAVGRFPDDDLAHYLRAIALWKVDRKEEALEALESAAECGTISEALVPYYHFYRGEYLEELGRPDEALEAYKDSLNEWRQDITLAFMLLAAFERLEDADASALIEEEIEIIAEQDALAIAIGRINYTTSQGGVIVTGEGETQGDSFIYEPGFQD